MNYVCYLLIQIGNFKHFYVFQFFAPAASSDFFLFTFSTVKAKNGHLVIKDKIFPKSLMIC